MSLPEYIKQRKNLDEAIKSRVSASDAERKDIIKMASVMNNAALEKMACQIFADQEVANATGRPIKIDIQKLTDVMVC